MLFDNKTSQYKKTVKDKKVIDSIKCRSVFSSRETEILQLIALEYTNEEIAEKLCLAKRTVDNHRVNLMQRVNAKNTAGLIGYAFRNGLVM
jgi:DNA-binding NarL/FixJ family response regulator